jgi:hypothetical protein
MDSPRPYEYQAWGIPVNIGRMRHYFAPVGDLAYSTQVGTLREEWCHHLYELLENYQKRQGKIVDLKHLTQYIVESFEVRIERADALVAAQLTKERGDILWNIQHFVEEELAVRGSDLESSTLDAKDGSIAENIRKDVGTLIAGIVDAVD